MSSVLLRAALSPLLEDQIFALDSHTFSTGYFAPGTNKDISTKRGGTRRDYFARRCRHY
jgi:hypothetical protein